MKTKIIFFTIFILVCFYTLSFGYELNIYPKSLATQLDLSIKNPSAKNLNKLHEIFIKNKGIEDNTIAYALTEALLNHPDKINEKTIAFVQSFSLNNKDKIALALSKQIVPKIGKSYKYFNKFAIYTFVKYISGIFLILIFIYLLLKNYFIFLHSHKHPEKNFGLGKLFGFILLALISSIVLSPYFCIVLAGFSIVLLIPEENKNKIIVIIFISIFSILNSIDYQQHKNINSEYLYLSKKSVSKEYLSSIIEQKNSPIVKIITKIKFPNMIKEKINFKPRNRFEAGNYAIYLLIEGKIKEFNKIAGQFNLLEDPVILMNITSFFSKSFQYENYEETLQTLYNFYPKYHKLLQTFQIALDSQVFLPYFTVENPISSKLKINFIGIIIYFILLILGYIINHLFYNTKFFQCTACGELFCVNCDDGFLHNNICEKCRVLLKRINKADATTLVKKQFQIDKYQLKRKLKQFILKIFLPGADKIYNRQIIFGIIVTFFYAIFLFILLFQFEPFVAKNNIGFQIAIKYLYYAYFCIFIIVYIVNLLVRRKNNGF